MGKVLSKNSYIGRNQYYNWESHWALLSKTTPSKSANHGVYCTIGWSSRKSNVHRFLVFTLPDFLRTGSAQLVGWRRGGSLRVLYTIYYMNLRSTTPAPAPTQSAVSGELKSIRPTPGYQPATVQTGWFFQSGTEF